MSRQRTTSVMVCVLLMALSFVSCHSNNDGDSYVRYVSYQEFVGDRSTRVFSGDGFVDFSRVVVDHDLQQLIVGVRNHLLRLRLSNLRLLEQVRWTSDNATVSMCIAKGQSQENCHNFIRVLLLHNNLVFACGTNSYSPRCSWRKRRLLGDVVSWVRGAAKCPYGPRQNASYVMTADGNYYSATVADFAGRDAAVYRSMGPGRQLRTAQYNSRWLNDPDFVSSYDVDGYVYFFFRETAVEYINCGKMVYSRVARVCKRDAGGSVLLQDNWTTFVKARLNCSLPGQFPFYYNELQSTFLLRKQRLVYAVFTTSPTSVYGSAVCVYNLTAFDVAFEGPFKYQRDSQSAWTRVHNHAPIKCDSAKPGTHVSRDSSSSQRHLVHVQKFQLMDKAVQPTQRWPTIVADQQRFSHIVVDRVEAMVDSVRRVMDVVFLSTIEGFIYRYVVLRPPSMSSSSTADSDACLLERIRLTPVHQTIASLTLDQRNGGLIVGTSSHLYRFPVRLCHRLKTRQQCIGSQDPYCSWNDRQHKCSAKGNPNIYSCRQRILSLTVEGKWSEWSSWQRCSVPALETTLTCQCRSRTCHQPPSQSHQLSCRGDAIQVNNCTIHTSVSGQWSVWSEWSPCSGQCGGQQVRHRTCVVSGHIVAVHQCSGEHQQTRVCSLDHCKEVRRQSSWSEWLGTSMLDEQGQRRQQRMRCVCRALVNESSRPTLRRPRLHLQSRYQNTTKSSLMSSSAAYQLCNQSSTTDGTFVRRQVKNELMISQATPALPSNIPSSLSDDESSCPTRCASVVSSRSKTSLHHNNSKLSPASSARRQFTGFCRCRDLGPLRVCQRCPAIKTPPTNNV